MSTARSQFRRVAGLRCRVLQCGSGRPLLLLASPFIFLSFYRAFVRHLSDGFRLCVVEMPGSGLAARVKQPWGFEDYAHWLAEAIPQLSPEPPIVLGHSNSGPPAILLAAYHPEVISHLVLADSVGTHPTRSRVQVVAGRIADARFELWLSFTKAHQLLLNALLHGSNFWRQLNLAATFDLAGHPVPTSIPTLLAWGARDLTMPLQAARALHQLIPNASLYVHPTGGHNWLITHPDDFRSALTTFLSSATEECLHTMANDGSDPPAG